MSPLTDAEILAKYGEPPSGYASHQQWIARCRRVEALPAVTIGKVAEQLPIKKFRLHWLGRKTEEVSGTDIANAFSRAGYGGGAMAALDYYEPIE